MTVIDAHHHVGDLEARDQPWISGDQTGLSDAERARVPGGTAARVYQIRGQEASWH
jgi:hypothetical protein